MVLQENKSIITFIDVSQLLIHVADAIHTMTGTSCSTIIIESALPVNTVIPLPTALSQKLHQFALGRDFTFRWVQFVNKFDFSSYLESLKNFQRKKVKNDHLTLNIGKP